MRRIQGGIGLAIAASVAAVIGCGAKTIVDTVTPTTITLGLIQSGGWVPQNCASWTSNWPSPQDWWNSLPTSRPPRGVDEAAVGFEILTDTRSGCTKFRQDLYRAGFTYDLSNRQALKGLVQKAELTFFSHILPAGVSATGMCQAVTAGGGSLVLVPVGTSLPSAPTGFANLGGLPPPAAFPAGARVFSMMVPWFAGPVPAVASTGVTVSTLATGLGGASFTVDVTSYITGALSRGDPSIAFMLGGIDEAPLTIPTSTAIDCKTWYRIGGLTIEHY